MKNKTITLILTMALLLVMIPADFVVAEEVAPDEVATEPGIVAPDTDIERNAPITPVESFEPVKITAKATKKGSIIINWDVIEGAVSYQLFRSSSINGTYKCIKNLAKTSFTDKKIHPKKRYYYKIKVIMPENGRVIQSYDSSVVSAKLKIRKSFKVKAYAYSGGGYTKIGKKAMVGRIAVDPKVIKLGTWLYVEGYGVCQACDIGGNIKGKTIDVYQKSEKKVNKWGVRKPRVYILG